MNEEALTPVLHVENANAAVAWYERLGFVMDTEWSSGPVFTETTAVIRRGELALILSSRERDARADGLIYLRVSDLSPIEKEFNLKATSFFGGQHLELHDPDGNRIRVVSVNIQPRKGRLIGAS
jgi:catechol 2,3-dioxygenase-like lactoylglutathione lyase family enzyme